MIETFDCNLIRLGHSVRPKVDLMTHRQRVQNLDFKLHLHLVEEIAKKTNSKRKKQRDEEEGSNDENDQPNLSTDSTKRQRLQTPDTTASNDY